MAEEEVGKVTHYFSKIGVAAIAVTAGKLSVGDTIHIKGHTSDFQEQVHSIELDGKSVPEATPGQNVGIRVSQHAREHDVVLRVNSQGA